LAKIPEPPNPTSWDTYCAAYKAKWIGSVEAADADATIDAAAKEFKIDSCRLTQHGGDHVGWCKR
jgi:hypothetical protein